MIEWIASVQPLVIAALLTWAGVVKLRGLRTPEEVSRSAIGRIVGDERASLTWRMVGGVELLIAGRAAAARATPRETRRRGAARGRLPGIPVVRPARRPGIVVRLPVRAPEPGLLA